MPRLNPSLSGPRLEQSVKSRGNEEVSNKVMSYECPSLVPEDGGPEGLQGRPVVEDEVDVVAEEGHQGDGEHRGDEEEE